MKPSISFGAFAPTSQAMGPGRRAVLWVRGCPMRCAGCITPEFLSRGEPHHEEDIDTICEWIDRAINKAHIQGVSFSGGEPFAQAIALASIAEHARHRGLSTLSWSGFTREHLEGARAPSGSENFLHQLDVLIDGLFVQRHARNDPLRGSSNQRVHFLTDRYGPEEVASSMVEAVLEKDGTLVTTGVINYTGLGAVLELLGVR